MLSVLFFQIFLFFYATLIQVCFTMPITVRNCLWSRRGKCLGMEVNMNKKILIYNNQTGIAEKMEPLLIGEGLECLVAADLQELYEKISENIHLMLVDVELNDKGWDKGIEMIVALRRKSSVPVIVVSSQSAETAKIMALEAGADDYVTTDCNPLELLARIKSQLRRYVQLVNMCREVDRIYKVEGLEINDIQRTVTVEGRNVRLTPIEYKILRFLVQQQGKVFSNSQIYENIWHMQAIGADNTIAVHIRHIREKIERNPKEPRYLKVVWGIGYKVG